MDNTWALTGRFLFPEGVSGIVEAVNMIADSSAPRFKQTHVDNINPPYYDQKWQSLPKLTGRSHHKSCITSSGGVIGNQVRRYITLSLIDKIYSIMHGSVSV